MQYLARFAPKALVLAPFALAGHGPLQLAPGLCRLHWPPAAGLSCFGLVRQHSKPQAGPGPAHNDPGQLVTLPCPEHLSMPQVRRPCPARVLLPYRGCPGQHWTKQAPWPACRRPQPTPLGGEAGPDTMRNPERFRQQKAA